MPPRLNALLIDIQPLRTVPQFRWLWIGNSLTALGGRVTAFAVALQIWELTGSPLAVGAVGLTILVPTLVVGLLGGSLADSMDRRTLVLITSSSLAAVSTALAVQAFVGNTSVWLIYVLTTLQALLTSIGGPARKTFVPRLLPEKLLPAGYALDMFAFQVSIVAGPALAGLITAVGGVKACYAVEALAFLAALYGVYRLPPMRAEGVLSRPGMRAVAEGLRFVRRQPIIAGSLLSDLNATVLAMPFALFPAINDAHFGGSPTTLGLLGAAPGVGGVIATLLSGPVGRVTRRGAAILACGVIWGVALAAFGITRQLWLALVLLGIAGAVDAICVVLRGAVIQLSTPDNFRGRVTAVDHVVGIGGPELGNFKAGVVASVATPSLSAVTGGLGSVIGIVTIAAMFPALRQYRAEER